MKALLMVFCALSLAGTAMAGEPVARSDVEARLDALEVINVTSQKAPRIDTVATDEELDAILAAADAAESAD